MKQRSKTAYLIVSSAHLGVSEDILATYAQVAKTYKAKVVHLGPLATDQEIRTHAKLKHKVSELKAMLANASTDRQEEAISTKLLDSANELAAVTNEQAGRMEALKGAFGKVTYVTTKDLMLPVKAGAAEVVYNGMELSKYIFLSPVPPAGPKSTRAPITANSVAYLKELGCSWIVAHPVPKVDGRPKVGLNEAYNYYTVGGLKHAALPTHTRNQYEFAHMPCAILVLIDNENGEFHARQMHIDYIDKAPGKKTGTMVIDDGLVFLPGKTLEVGSADKATFGTDYHACFQHAGVVGAHRTLNVLHEPETLIDGGDMGDFGSVSHWLESKPGESEGLRLRDDLLGVRSLMDALTNTKSIKKKILIDSNHHEWLTDYISKNPALKGILDWQTLADDMFKDWDVMIRSAGENKVCKFGDLTIRHGDKDGGCQSAEGIYTKYLCGHFHKFATYRRSIQLGCGARLGPKYTGGQVNAWQSQLATITKYKGVAAVSPKIILHDKVRDVSRFAYRDKIIEVDAYHIKT